MESIKQSIKFTIITCTFNSEKYLEECIDSVRKQDFKNYEHIFVDAFSTDSTISMIKDYQLSNPSKIKIVQQEPQGISNAMNVGIGNAKGEIIVHLHSDDYFYDSRVLSLVDKKFIESDAMVVVGNCMYKKEDGLHTIWPKNKFILWLFFKFIRSYLFLRNGIPHPSTFIKKEVFIRNGAFLENLKVVMDCELWFRLLKKEKFIFMSDYLSVYRAHGATVSGMQVAKGKEEMNQVFKKYKNQYLFDYVFYLLLIKPFFYLKSFFK